VKLFMLQLAGHLGKSLREIEEFDCDELAHWMAYHRFFRPLNDPWQHAGIIASAALAPHAKRGREPKPRDFIPIETPPQHRHQMHDQLLQLKRMLGK
jgi:hypothetical protein